MNNCWLKTLNFKSIQKQLKQSCGSVINKLWMSCNPNMRPNWKRLSNRSNMSILNWSKSTQKTSKRFPICNINWTVSTLNYKWLIMPTKSNSLVPKSSQKNKQWLASNWQNPWVIQRNKTGTCYKDLIIWNRSISSMLTELIMKSRSNASCVTKTRPYLIKWLSAETNSRSSWMIQLSSLVKRMSRWDRWIWRLMNCNRWLLLCKLLPLLKTILSTVRLQWTIRFQPMHCRSTF